MEDNPKQTIQTMPFSLNKRSIIKLIYQFNFVNRWYVFFCIYFLLALYHAAVIYVGFGTNPFFLVFICVMYCAPVLGFTFSILVIRRFLKGEDGRFMANIKRVTFMEEGICLFMNDDSIHFMKNEQISYITESNGYLLLFLSRHVFISIPYSAFEPGKKDAAVQMLKSQGVKFSHTRR